MAAEPPPGPEARPGLWAELVDNRQSYLKLVKEFDEDLATMRAARLGFLDSDDREALVRRWNAARSRCELRLVVENRLRNEYRSALHLVKLGLVANNLPAKGRAQDRTAQEASTARVALQERHAYEIRAEGYRMTRELDIESAAWGHPGPRERTDLRPRFGTVGRGRSGGAPGNGRRPLRRVAPPGDGRVKVMDFNTDTERRFTRPAALAAAEDTL